MTVVLEGMDIMEMFVKFLPYSRIGSLRSLFCLQFRIFISSYAEITKPGKYRWMPGIPFLFIATVLNAPTLETNVLCNSLVKCQEQHLHLHSVN